MVCCCGLSAFISVVIFVEKLCFIQEIKCLNFFLIPASLRIMKKTKRKTNRRYHFYLLCILFKMTFTKIFYSPINIATDCQFSNLVGYGHISGLSWRALFVLCYETLFKGFILHYVTSATIQAVALQPAVWGISCLVLLPSPCNDSACTYHSTIFAKPQ